NDPAIGGGHAGNGLHSTPPSLASRRGTRDRASGHQGLAAGVIFVLATADARFAPLTEKETARLPGWIRIPSLCTYPCERGTAPPAGGEWASNSGRKWPQTDCREGA